MHNNVAPTGIFTYKHIFFLADGQARQWGELKVETCLCLKFSTQYGHNLDIFWILSWSLDILFEPLY